MRKTQATLLAAIAATLLAGWSFAGTIDVGLGGGYSFSTIQDGINAASAGDTILVYPGIYSGAGNRDINFNGKDVKLISAGGRDTTIIDVDNGYRGFYINSGETSEALIQGFTVRNAYMTFDGAGMYCHGSSPTIRGCSFENNTCWWDYKGGGICMTNGSNSLIEDCVFDGNAARHGGAICARNNSDIQVVNCTFENNEAYYAGAGIWAHTCSPYVGSSVFTDNVAIEYGGAIRFNVGTFTVENSIFAENMCGCGVTIETATMILKNCTLADNEMDAGDGYGIYVAGLAELLMVNSVVWGNEVGSILLHEDALGVDVTYSDIEGGWLGDGNINVDPAFVGGSYRILWNSPCVDAGTDCGVYVDIDGNVRPYDVLLVDNNGPLADFDMGAYEVVPEPSLVLVSGLMLLGGLLRRRFRGNR